MVLHYPAPGDGPSGIATYATSVAEALRAQGEPVHPWPVRDLEIRIGGRGYGGLVARRLQNLRRPRPGQVLHSAHAYAAHPRAQVATVHDCFPETLGTLLGRTPREERLWASRLAGLVRRRSRFVMATRAVRDTFLSLHPEVDADRCHLVTMGIDRAFAPAPDEPRHQAYHGDGLQVLAVGDLNPRKRLDWLLEAAVAVPGVHVTHAGVQFAHRPAWQAQAAREAPLARRLGSRFQRLGPVGRAELARLYRGADLVVVPSLDEGFGFPALEALASGTPVAVADGAVVREVLQDQALRFTGVAELRSLLAERKDAPPASLGQRRQRSAWVRARYTWEEAARGTREVYRAVEAESRRARPAASPSSSR